jgi:hypothetical protein
MCCFYRNRRFLSAWTLSSPFQLGPAKLFFLLPSTHTSPDRRYLPPFHTYVNAHSWSRKHLCTDTSDCAVSHTYTMSTATNPRDVEEQIARILRYKAATAKDEESVRVLKTKSTELDKEIANIEFDEKGQEAYKVMRALLNRITDCEVKELQRQLIFILTCTEYVRNQSIGSPHPAGRGKGGCTQK